MNTLDAPRPSQFSTGSTPLRSAYNCVFAAMYNHLVQDHRLSLRIESLYITKSLLQLWQFDGLLCPFLPEEMVRSFMRGTGLRMTFPDVGNVESALAFARDHLARRRVLSVAVNLRYDVLEPLTFDNDFWHLQLMVEPLVDGGFRMYDQFEDKFFVYTEDRMRLAIDTGFNRRISGQFTPFMVIEVDDLEGTAAKLAEAGETNAQVQAALRDYPLKHNLDHAVQSVRHLRRYATERPSAEVMYRVMNYHLIIQKSREALIDALVVRGLAPPEFTATLVERWSQVRALLGVILMRRDLGEFDRLEDVYRQLIELEEGVFRSLGECSP
ncbi:MAG: hypothetical protein IPP19_14260 [Verrucomicrobia bacterium]|nr:hypothetical protein [Verrucomicrobiota bacterium]